LVWEGLTNREIGKIIGTSEQVVKNHLRAHLTNSESGLGWNWQCTSPAMAEKIALPKTKREIPRAHRNDPT
jgi:hypothetical protein